jgi:hypothetical protein
MSFLHGAFAPQRVLKDKKPRQFAPAGLFLKVFPFPLIPLQRVRNEHHHNH